LLTLHLNFPALMEKISSMDNVFCSNTDWEASRVLLLCNSEIPELHQYTHCWVQMITWPVCG
jgi:hypothetical protein